MAAYFTRSVQRPPGFYRSLNGCNTVHTALLEGPATSTRQSSLPEREIDQEDVYEVERLVQCRRSKGGGVEYLVLWAGYRKEDASWVKDRFITRPALQYFADPHPSVRDILDCTSSFLTGINKSLKMGLNRSCHITVNFRTDVFNFLFNDKGTNYPHGPGRLFGLEDFDKNFFPTDWHRVHDRLGDGCEIQFPVRLQSRVKWEYTVYIRENVTGQIAPKKRNFEEVCIIWIVKQRCS